MQLLAPNGILITSGRAFGTSLVALLLAIAARFASAASLRKLVKPILLAGFGFGGSLYALLCLLVWPQTTIWRTPAAPAPPVETLEAPSAEAPVEAAPAPSA